MPWQCNVCTTTVNEDDGACPGCQAPKTSWTVFHDATRTFVVSARKFELLRDGTPTKEAQALTKSAAHGLAKGSWPPQTLTVRLHPKQHQDLTITLGIGYVGKVFEERPFPVERPADLVEGGYVDVPFLFLFGAGEPPADDAFPHHRVVDVSEETEAGYAPQVEFTALGKRPKEVTVTAGRKKADLLEVEDAHFHSGSAVLLPEHEGVATRVAGLDVLVKALEHAEENPGLKLLITGHTDTTGSMESNVALAELRARSVHNALTGDRDGWVEVANERDKPEDHQLIANWVDGRFGWGCHAGPVDGKPGAKTREGIETFQRRYNQEFNQDIGVDGKVGPQTLGAFFDVYERALAEQLETDAAGLAEYRADLAFVEPAAVGCGEYHPIDNAKADDYRSAKNRRVELLFFQPGEEPQLACHAGGAGSCDPAACPIYDYVAYYTEPLPVAREEAVWLTGPTDPERYYLRAVLYRGRDLREAMPNETVHVTGPIGHPGDPLTITSDAEGLAMSPDVVPAGVYLLEVGDRVGRACAVPYAEERYPTWLDNPEPTTWPEGDGEPHVPEQLEGDDEEEAA